MSGQPRSATGEGETGQSRDSALASFAATRRRSLELAAPLTPEDQGVQSMPDASPTKWHLAHASWFFETFILVPHLKGYAPFDDAYGYLFNSYYEAVGPRHARPERGLLSRPTLDNIRAYRRHVEDAIKRLVADADAETWEKAAPLLALGVNHEQQHQELILTDILNAFAANPLRPAYKPFRPHGVGKASALEWIGFPEGLVEIGAPNPKGGGDGFAFDNEGPRHKAWLEAFRIASRPVTNGEYLEFIADGGYQRPELWLADGWTACRTRGWLAPLYWENVDGAWRMMTLAGMRAVDAAEPVCHVSYFEADAFARWAGKRLPTEAEWEIVAAGVAVAGNFADRGHFHPIPCHAGGSGAKQMFGDVWEWTASAYGPYPRFRPAAGAVGEYNGKFMSGQMVLRGGSASTPAGHVRASYRNFFYPPDRWQFSGIRLARDA